MDKCILSWQCRLVPEKPFHAFFIGIRSSTTTMVTSNCALGALACSRSACRQLTALQARYMQPWCTPVPVGALKYHAGNQSFQASAQQRPLSPASQPASPQRPGTRHAAAPPGPQPSDHERERCLAPARLGECRWRSPLLTQPLRAPCRLFGARRGDFGRGRTNTICLQPGASTPPVASQTAGSITQSLRSMAASGNRKY